MSALNPDKLSEYLLAQRWFAGKSVPIKAVSVLDSVDLSEALGAGVMLAVVQVVYELGLPERYLLPVRVADDGSFEDALEQPELAQYLLKLVRDNGQIVSTGTTLKGTSSGAASQLLQSLGDQPTLRRMKVEQSNTSLVFGERVILKIIRKLALGLNPEVEMGRFFAARTGLRSTPTLLGSLEFEGAVTASAALIHQYVVSDGDGWRYLTDALAKSGPIPAAVLAEVEEMGTRVAEMHLALAEDTENPAFAPEPILTEDLQRWSASVIGELGVSFAKAVPRFPELQDRRDALVERAQRLARVAASGQKTRLHGDLHLGQLLQSEQGWLIIDFEGEPQRAFEQRREKHSPLRDVAGMLRSLNYAVAAAAGGKDVSAASVRPLRDAFLRGYRTRMGRTPLLPDTDETMDALLDVFELEKALYELRYELQMRPEWAHIPVQALLGAEVKP